MPTEPPAPSGQPHILVVEDHRVTWEAIELACAGEPWKLSFVPTGEQALELLEASPDPLDLLLLDIGLPGIDGNEVLERTRARDPGLPVVVVTASTDADTAVGCMRAGAYDYITKPFDPQELVHRVRRALEARHLYRRVAAFEATNYLSARMGPSEVVGRLSSLVTRVAATDMAVYVEGESGTGKELLARHIHATSPRADAPFVTIDCGAIPESLIESELFGARKGSYTGATRDRKGVFQAADGGTIFLDEIANLPLAQQARLLRVLQEKRVLSVGATRPVPVDVRVVSASNVSLEELVRRDAFRLDLYHRLVEFPIRIPPIRERPEDLLYLAMRFYQESCREFDKQLQGFSEQALQQVLEAPWTGNVRELRTTIRRAVLMSEGRIEEMALRSPPHRQGAATRTFESEDSIILHAKVVLEKRALAAGEISLKDISRRIQRTAEWGIIRHVLSMTGENKRKAARLLHVDYKTIYNKLNRFGNPERVRHGQQER